MSCAEGDVGRVYRGRHSVRDLGDRPWPPCPSRSTEIMVNLGDPGPGLPHGAAAERRRRPGAHGVHHPGAHRHPSDGAGRARQGRLGEGQGDDRRGSPAAIAKPADFFVERLSEGVGDDRRGLLPAPGDRAPVGLQDQRIRRPDRRRRLRAEGGQSDARASAARRATTIRPTRRASPSNARRCAGCARRWA